MMPDLGKYAASVLSAYGASIVLLAGFVWLSLRAGRKARAELAEVEKRREKSDAN